MADILDRIDFLMSETDAARLPACAAEAAFVGRSNVGKSSLINALTRKDLARVSNTPGRTRTINVFDAGGRWLVDLPGYGFAAAPPKEQESWSAMIEGYLSGRPSLKLVFVLVDAKVGPTKLDHGMLDWLESKNVPYVVACTKADQVGAARAQARKRDIARELGLKVEELIWVSAAKGLGVRELRGRLCALLQEA